MEATYARQKIQDWYLLYSDDIYRYILMMIGDHEQAKDLTHDTFIKAYNSLNRFEENTSDKNWLYKIARNVTIDYIRKRKPIQFITESFAFIPSKEPCPEEIAQLGESEEQLYRSLKKLKRSYQEVIILRKIKELSIRETAEVLDWNEGKVKTTLFRGLHALKQQMIKEGYEHDVI
ncbi:RNA polymerase sigma-70 factor, ECF subfamily [Evansella caseinilytica]|uniref:RNA polymerase sigma-70 factor, ECF subfamily n=1 Tax=Evansella caseinilytica TaxID=1503961 RepID=A0A1H3IF36_9BACI|nr:RNA polymerase sigma factor [Evansella caseinilytica]SDY26222.1 RNA polymerase sigma-70 factor, ECF subfamily [Evansella caseinilytica]